MTQGELASLEGEVYRFNSEGGTEYVSSHGVTRYIFRGASQSVRHHHPLSHFSHFSYLSHYQSQYNRKATQLKKEGNSFAFLFQIQKLTLYSFSK